MIRPGATEPAAPKRHAWVAPAGVLLLAAFALALSLPMLGGTNFAPDAAEYAGMARRWAEGLGLTTAIKWHFFDQGPVVRPAVLERPILYPLFAGVVLRLFGTDDPFQVLQVANAALSALNAVLALAAFRTVVPAPAAWVGAVLLALSRPMTDTAAVALGEQLFLALWLTALLLLPRVSRLPGAAAFGFAAGLATLARPNGLLLLALPLLLSRARGERPAPRALALALASALVILIPFFLYARAAAAPGMRPGTLVNFAVLHIHEATWDGFGRTLPSPLEFVMGHPVEIAAAIARKTLSNLSALWLSLGTLWLLLLPPAGKSYEGTSTLRRVWLWAGAANLLFYSLAWAAAGAIRYLLPTTAVLLPLLAERGIRAAGRSRGARAFVAVAVLAAIAGMGAHWQACRLERRQRWNPSGRERYRVGAAWIEEHSGPGEVVASNNPWMVHSLTRRPALACPNFRPGAGMDALAGRFDVRWVLLFCYPRDSRLRHCLSSPRARLVRQARDHDGRGIYLFSVGRSRGARAAPLARGGISGPPTPRPHPAVRASPR